MHDKDVHLKLKWLEFHAQLVSLLLDTLFSGSAHFLTVLGICHSKGCACVFLRMYYVVVLYKNGGAVVQLSSMERANQTFNGCSCWLTGCRFSEDDLEISLLALVQRLFYSQTRSLLLIEIHTLTS